MKEFKLTDLLFDQLQPAKESTKSRSLVDLLEDKGGWDEFLRTCGPRTFTEPFADFHADFWTWYWHLTGLRKQGLKITGETLTFLMGWSRGAGKSSAVEWACITEGAMGLPGYVLYVSATQASANNHVSEIRKRLESEDVAKYFPGLANPKMGRHGNRYGWREDFLITESGWAIRPVGLDVATRGFKEGELRPTLIVFDDIDTHDVTLSQVMSNLNTIARSILPSGTKNTIHLIAQNLIAEHCAVNQIYTGQSDILSDHIPSVVKAFEKLEVDTTIDEATGRTVNKIIYAEPTWAGMDIEAAQIFLSKTGLEAFYAEYQHDFSLDQTERVLPEYLDWPTHVISWSQFEDKFHTRNRMPVHWQVGLGLDIGYTADHLTAWSWVGVAAEDSFLPYAHFCFRAKTFAGVGMDEQIEEITRLVQYDIEGVPYDEREQYTVSVMSHEKLGERMVLNRENGFNFTECQFKKESGIPQWRSLMRIDKKQKHPFHEDTKLESGLWEIGRPNFFFVVADGQERVPRNDEGCAIHRAQTKEWKRRKVILTNSGVQEAIPMKYQDDAVDSLRMIFSEDYLSSTPLTKDQVLRHALQERLRREDLEMPYGNVDFQGIMMGRQMAFRAIEKEKQDEVERIAGVVRNVLRPPQLRKRR